MKPTEATAIMLALVLGALATLPRPAEAQTGARDACVRHVDAGDHERAMQCYEARLKRDPKDIGARNALAAIHFTERRFEQARAEFGEVLRIQPDNGVALNGKAMSLIALGRSDDGFKTLERAILTDPANILAVNNLALLAFSTGQIEIAEQSWTHTLSIEANNADARVGMAEVRIAQRNFPDAVDHLEVAVRQDPDNARAHWLLGKIAAQADSEDGLALLERAASLAPNDPGVLYDWGLVLFAHGDIRRAGAAFGAALRLAPKEPRLYFHVGRCYLATSAFSDALTFFDEALRWSPARVLASRIHFYRGVALERLQREQDAEQAYRLALQLDPGNASASVNLGVVLFGRKQFAEAATAFQAAVTSSSLPEAYLGLWLSRRHQNRTDEARIAYARLMELPEGHPVRKQAETISGQAAGPAQPMRATPVSERPSSTAPRPVWP